MITIITTPNTVQVDRNTTDSVILTPETNQVTVQESSNQVIISPSSTQSVVVNSQGIQGPPGPPGTGGYSEGVASESISVYQILSSIGSSLSVADPTDMSHIGKVIGIAIQSVSGGATVRYVQTGTISGGSWIAGSRYYLGLDGSLSTTPQAVGRVFQQFIGIATSMDTLVVNMSPPIILE